MTDSEANSLRWERHVDEIIYGDDAAYGDKHAPAPETDGTEPEDG
jgi:hypothetical protein